MVAIFTLTTSEMSSHQSQRRKGSLIFFWGMLLGGLLFSRKFQLQSEQISSVLSEVRGKYFRMEQISQLLSREYYDKDSLLSGQQAMIESATKAFVEGLGDPFTSYLDAEQFSGLQSELEGDGQIEGIGAVVSKKDYYVQVEELVKDSPAFKAGLMPLDRIILIWTGETKELNTSEAVSQIRGPKGSTVELFIERLDKDGQKSYLEKQVVRDIIDVPSVRSKILTQSGVQLWYLEVSVFGDQTNKLFTRAISELLDAQVQGIILDLRGNGWGLLQSAVDLAGHFLPKGELVVKTKYSTFEDLDYASKGFWELEKMPLVVLVDGLSASSSEILALALREQLNAQIIGVQSFWKGSIQTLYDFEDKTSLKYTIGRWCGPKGTTIDKEGIKPDLEVPFNFTGYVDSGLDNQLLKAQEVLMGKINK